MSSFFVRKSQDVFQAFLIFTKRFEQLRFIGYLKSILTTYENIKEIKVNRLHAFIKDIVIQRFDEFLQEDKKIRKNSCSKIV